MGEANEPNENALGQAGEDAMVAGTMGGRVHVRWHESARATPHGQIVCFAEFLATAGVFDRWAEDCLLRYSRRNASRPRDFLAGDARIKSRIRAKVNSGGREVANSEILRQRLFSWPPIDAQDRIIERVQAIEAPARLDQDRLRKLRMQKQGLIQDLLTCKVPVRAE